MADYKANKAGMREFLRDGSYARALEDHARPIEARAKGYARVESAEDAAERGRTPGKFRDSIHVERHEGPRRHTARVVADCEGAIPIELRDRALGRAVG